MPVVGPVPGTPGLFVGTAHAMMGMTLGPVSGRAIAEHVLGRTQSLALPMCDPSRYFTNAPPRAVASGTQRRAADAAVPAA
jgi:D-amino-acid dehydrogenase